MIRKDYISLIFESLDIRQNVRYFLKNIFIAFAVNLKS